MENQQQENKANQNPSAENFTPSSVEGLRPSAHKPDKRIIIGGIVVIILALSAIGAQAYSWWQNSKTLNQKACTMEAKLCPDGSSVGRTGPNCEFALCPPLSASPSPSNEVEGWQTYRNEKYGYEIKYPKDWKYIEGQFQDNQRNDSISLHKISDYPNVSFDIAFSISLLKMSEYCGETSEIIIDNIKTQKCTIGLDLNRDYGRGPFGYEGDLGTVIYLSKDASHNYEIYFIDATMGEYQDILNQILSTFKFIPSTSSGQVEPIDTSNWQTYRNEKYGFEIQYPQDMEIVNVSNSGLDLEFLRNEKAQYDFVIEDETNSVMFDSKGVQHSITDLDTEDLLSFYFKQRCKNIDLNKIYWQEIQIGNGTAIKVDSNDDCAKQWTPWTYIMRNNKWYNFYIWRGSSSEFDQILSTFKFIN